MKEVRDALQAWASTYPRRATRYQKWVNTEDKAVEAVLDAEKESDNWPFISTYSFPRGHTKEGNVPRIDRLFFDFDVPDTGEYRGGEKHADAWARDMSRLLVRTRKVARFLLESNDPDCWQVVLSGHKGVHLDLVFPPIDPANGDYLQFRNGMGSYADMIINYIKDATNLDDLDTWVDVSSADLGRMRRVPNTKHRGASESFGEDRFCVPVTLDELADIGPAEYIELTRSRRPVIPWMKATPNETAGEVLTQMIRNAQTTKRITSSGSRPDQALVEEYEDRSNDSITVDSLPLLLSDRPCILEYIERKDLFSHRTASHLMEMFAITHMIDRDVPIETIIEFFSQAPGFDEQHTRNQIEQFISRKYSPMNCETIWEQADQFCLGDSCRLYSRAK